MLVIPLPEIIATLRRKLQGHWNYYGVIGNSDSIWTFAHHAKRLVFKLPNLRARVGALGSASPTYHRHGPGQLDNTDLKAYDGVRQQETKHDRSSTCAHSRGDLRGGHRATDVPTLMY